MNSAELSKGGDGEAYPVAVGGFGTSGQQRMSLFGPRGEDVMMIAIKGSR